MCVHVLVERVTASQCQMKVLIIMYSKSNADDLLEPFFHVRFVFNYNENPMILL